MNCIPVTRPSLPPIEEYMAEIRPLWDSHCITNRGVKYRQLRRELKRYLDVEHLELVVNGHSALELALQAFDLQGEVITTPFTFVSTTQAIVGKGLTPVFCDIDPNTFCIDVSKIEDLITEKTCAIVPVHVYGNVCETEEIENIAHRHGLKVIYDAAHAFGATYRGKSVLSYGDASIVSFHATKVFHTIEGGAICTKDGSLETKLHAMSNFGMESKERIPYIGTNAKMNEFCAAMGICNLRHLEEDINKRRMITERYRERLSGIRGIQLNYIQKNVRSNYAYFPVLIDKEQFGQGRDEVCMRLSDEGISARKYFYPLTNEMECYEEGFASSITPVARRISRQVLTLPLYADLELQDVDQICDVVLQGR